MNKLESPTSVFKSCGPFDTKEGDSSSLELNTNTYSFCLILEFFS